jgi:hypothetical protein
MSAATIEQGIVAGMEMAPYRAINAVAASDLKNMQRSPAYAHMRTHTTSPAKEWGTAVHTAVLEPDALEARYRIEPQQPEDNAAKLWRSTKLYKEGKAALLAEPGVEGVLSASELKGLEQIQRNVAQNKIGAKLHEVGGIREASVFAWDDEFDLWRKVRPDWLIETASMVVDVKTDQDYRPGPFARACKKWGYHVSGAYYMDTLSMVVEREIEHYVFLVVNTDAPHEVASYTLDEDSIQQGRHEYRRALAEWHDCAELGRWPGGSDEIGEIRLPEYAITYHMDPEVY